MSAFFVQHPKETDLALFAGGELGPFARWRIERHLETCPECKQTVADFFHLSEELSPLADIPEVDWSAMARNIEARLAVEGPETASAGGRVAPWTWQLGAAAACALVAVVALQLRPQAEAPRATEAVVVAQEYAADKASLESAGGSEPFAEAEQDEETPVAPAPEPSIPEAVMNEAKKMEAPVDLAFADRQLGRLDERLSTDAAAPAPPAQSSAFAADAPGAPPAAKADADLIASSGLRRSREAAPARAMAFGGAAARPSAAMFTIEPLPAAGDDPRVGGDGWISVRAVSADGAMTITEVYDPQ
ncbi:MAG: zf-HC2 domain-containing protein [Acidobacteria bacterium]|nr:zf-HC2 domain-containing protein [Acidobacteriota bacterium]